MNLHVVNLVGEIFTAPDLNKICIMQTDRISLDTNGSDMDRIVKKFRVCRILIEAIIKCTMNELFV